MQLKHQYENKVLKGSWANMYKAYYRADKDRTYLSKNEREVDRQHDILLKEEILKSQKKEEMLDNTTLNDMSTVIYSKARRIVAHTQYQESGFNSPLMKNILEMDELPQVLNRDDGNYYQVMCNISDRALSDDIIEWFKVVAENYDPTYHPENESINIILYSILVGEDFNEGKAEELSRIFRQEFYELISSKLKESEFNDGSYLIRFRTKKEKLKDWFYINFKV